MTVYGYARVSVAADGSGVPDNLQTQVQQLERAGCERIFREVARGARYDRPVLQELLAKLLPGDTVVFPALDRLGRGVLKTLELLDQLHRRDVTVKCLREGFDPTTPMGQAMMTICAALAELERSAIVERTKAGLERARQQGKLHGRKWSLTKDQMLHVRELRRQGYSWRRTAAAVGTSVDVCRRVCRVPDIEALPAAVFADYRRRS